MAAWFRRSNTNTFNSRSFDSSMPGPLSARPYIPSGDNGNFEAMMIDILINEIQMHITRLEDEHEKRRQELLKINKSPDYGWLIDWKECSSIEMLCRKIRPSEWSDMIREWRSRIRYIESRDDVLGVFRQVVEETINKRSHSRTSVGIVNELAQEADRHPSPKTEGNRSMSLLDLSVPDLFHKHFKSTHHVV